MTEQTTPFPVLYILMRNDLPSMNSGKAMAQASHCSNYFVKFMKDHRNANNESPAYWPELFKVWENTTPQGFGTVLVLAVNEVQMREAVRVAEMFGVPAGIVNDPTYPYQTTAELGRLVPEEKHTLPPMFNGDKATLFRSEDTCAFIFGEKDIVGKIVQNFPLHP